MPTPIIYPFDPNGTLPDNYIQNEPHNISQIGLTNAYLFVPEAGPFHAAGLTVVTSDGVTLAENTHYILTHYWGQASSNEAIGAPIYGSITMLGQNPLGLYYVNYHTVGGDYVVNKANAITDGFLATAALYTNVDWSTIPTSFPPTPHSLNTNALEHYPLICEAIMNLSNSVKTRGENIGVNEIDGFVGVWANSVLMPILELTIAQNHSNNVFANVAASIKLGQKRQIRPVNLQHYEIPFGNFVVKFGFHPFNLNATPTDLLFGGAPFTNNCIVAHAWVVPFSDTTQPCNDQLRVGAPQNDRVAVSFTPDNTYLGRRQIGYIAIGQ